MNETLNALGPLDGRYADKTAPLRPVFSEAGLMLARLKMETAWLKALASEPSISAVRAMTDAETAFLDAIIENFSDNGAARIKEIERTTNHDVKAIEYYLKEQIADTSLKDLVEFVHFACTSEDVNNVAHALMLSAGEKIVADARNRIIEKLKTMAEALRDTPMLARTHGQAASPTTMGKELAVFAFRLKQQSDRISSIKLTAKINGAVGNYNAHVIACPDTNWPELSRRIIEDEFGLRQNPLTIQIEPHDSMAEYFDALARWNTILIDLDRDIWTYVSLGYFKQKTVAGEVGSSTMPHKVNPIDFENSEGNLGIANAILRHFSEKLPISRLQRDLTDSTVLRNMGVSLGHSLLAYESTLKGLGKLEPDNHRMNADLSDAWEVLAEALQTVMRNNGIEQPYEKLKELTRGKKIQDTDIQNFIKKLNLPEEDAKRLFELSPATYTGLAGSLVKSILE